MATAIGDLVIRLGAQTSQFDKKMRMARSQLAATGTSAQKMSVRMTAGFGAAATSAKALVVSLGPLLGATSGAYGFFRLAASGEEFNRKMRQSLAIMDDVGESMRRNLRDTAFEVAHATRFSAAEAAEAYYFLFSAGLDARRAIAALPRVAKFAQAGNFDLAKATELAAGAQAAMGLKSDDAKVHLENLNRVTDVLVKANKLAQASTEQFATALLNDAANAGRVAGQSIEQVVAVLAAFAEKGLVGEEAGTAYARALNYLSIQAVENANAFERAGVKMFDMNDNTRTLVDVIADLEKRFAGMSDKERTAELKLLGFTKKTIALMNTLLGTSGSIKRFTEELNNAGGTVDKVAGDQLTPFQEGWKELTAGISAAGSALMDVMGPALKWIQKLIGSLAGDVGTLFRAFKKLDEGITGFLMDPIGKTASGIASILPGAPDLAAQDAKIARSEARLTAQDRLNEQRNKEAARIEALARAEADRSAAEKETARLKRLNFTTVQAALSWEQNTLSRVTTARERYNLTLQRINESTGLLTERQKELARDAAFRTLDTDTGGAAVKLQDLTDQYRLLTGEITKAGLALEKLDHAGDDPFAVEAVEKIQKAIAGVNAQQELKRMGEAFEDRFLTPLERARKTAGQAQKYHDQGAISDETLRRAKAAAGDSNAGDSNAGGSPGAFGKGSEQAWSSIMAATNQRREKTAERAAKDTAKNTNETVELLKELVDRPAEPFQEIPA